MATEPNEPEAFRGLTEAEVHERVARGQVNRVHTPVSRTTRQILNAHVFTRFNALLGALWAIVIAVGSWRDALFGGVIVVNALIGIAQELRAKWTLDRLALQASSHPRVVREGRVAEVFAEDIVIDDVLELDAGDPVLVDGIVLFASGLELDESLLTGESEPVACQRGDLVRSGSLVVAGSGRYQATAVGEAAWVHQLDREARRFVLARSELRVGIDRILRVVGWAILPTATLLFVSQFTLGIHLTGALLYSAAGVVAMVPQGLVLLTSLALAVGAVRLARRRALVQDLAATEALARVDVICLDKTGTLTERELRVHRLEPLADEPNTTRALAALAAAELRPNATLEAIARAWPAEAGGPALQGAVAFSSVRKWSGATLGELGTWVLGAPDILLADRPGTESLVQQVRERAASGLRVLLLARSETPLDANRLPAELAPVALVLLSERVRADAETTLRDIAAQGVTVRLISGDHPATVAAVARDLGIAGSDEAIDASTLTEDALNELAHSRTVFGRTSPRQKEVIVSALQAAGHAVAMVGDGVNDIPALKRADVGVAMGAGAPAARAVAQLILLDNRFANMPAIMAEGRRVVGDVERVAVLFLTKTVYAMLLALAVGIAGVAFPLLPRHISLVDALTIGFPAFLLSLEPNGERLRPGFVERVLHFAVPAGLFVAGATFAAFALVRTQWGADMPEARTAATLVLFAVSIWVLVLSATPLRLRRALLVGAMIALFLLTLIMPALRTFFALQLLPLGAWLACAAIAAAAAIALHWSRAVAAFMPRHPIPSRPLQRREIMLWLLGADSPKAFLVVAAVLVVGGAWLLFGVMEDIISHDPLVDVDVWVFHLLQALRIPPLNNVMVAITELGDSQVLLPVIVAALVWFVVRRLWLTAGYWIAAVGVAELLAGVIKLALHRPRPQLMYAGVEQFSFPSGHAVMSTAVYGFLAYLLLRRASATWRRAGAAATVSLIVLIGFSRLYLGAHWLSDVLGGLAFGVAWVAALAMAYEYQSQESLRVRALAVLMAGVFSVAALTHMATGHRADVERYASPIAAKYTGDDIVTR
ncbi:MAG: HAD-IC family P-type ATPase [Betaproteobacteria bacterium]|nr:HAD-IC family P-type ATPase [Betaproteobacteria bacterium]